MTFFFIPQLRVKDRYQEWWSSRWEKEIKKVTKDFQIVGGNEEPFNKTNYFTNEKEAINLELKQIKFLYNVVKKEDKVFWADLDYPSFSLALNYFLKQRGAKIYGIIHGAYFNKSDIWNGLNRQDFMKAQIKVCEKVFVGSEWFKQELISRGMIKEKLFNFGLPFYYKDFKPNFNKERSILVLGSISKDYINKIRGDEKDIKIYNRIMDGETYMDVLRKSKIVVSMKQVETFGYSVLEAVANGCFVITPKKFCYPEYNLYYDNGLSIIGTLKSLINLKKDDLKEFYDKHLFLFKKLEKSGSNILNEMIKDGR